MHLRHRLDVTPFQGTRHAGARRRRHARPLRHADDGTARRASRSSSSGRRRGRRQPRTRHRRPPFIPPSTTAIQTYLTSIASASVTYNPIALPNTQNDLDSSGSNQEYQLDVEMQSVGAPDAKDIDLVLSPASVVFQTGAQYIVNTLSSAVVVSTSLGDCESEEVSDDGGINTAGQRRVPDEEGRAARARRGPDLVRRRGRQRRGRLRRHTSDTKNGFGGGNATADFPCTVPEIVCMGGTQFEAAGKWNSSGDAHGMAGGEVWNEGSQGGAGGGGQSLLYPKPTWQTGMGPEATDGARTCPNLADRRDGDARRGGVRLRKRPGRAQLQHQHDRRRADGYLRWDQHRIAPRRRVLRAPRGHRRAAGSATSTRRLCARLGAARRRRAPFPRHHDGKQQLPRSEERHDHGLHCGSWVRSRERVGLDSTSRSSSTRGLPARATAACHPPGGDDGGGAPAERGRRRRNLGGGGGDGRNGRDRRRRQGNGNGDGGTGTA